MSRTAKTIMHLAVLGATISACLLSFGGVFALPLTTIIFSLMRRETAAELSAFFAAAIEGTIYKQNVEAALDFSLEHSIAKRLLNKLSRQPTLANNSFLLDYQNQKKYLGQLEDNLEKFRHSPNNQPDEEVAEREIQAVKKRLELMEKAFLIKAKALPGDTVNQLAFPQITSIDPLLSAKNKDNKLIVDEEQIKKEIHSKGWQIFFSKLASLGAGLCCCFVTFSSFHANLAIVGYKLTSIFFLGGYVVSGLAGIGYALLMCRMLSYLVQSEAVKNWFHKIKKFYDKENKSFLDYVKALAFTVLILTAVVGTIATAGTWLYLGVGAAFLPSSLSFWISLSAWVCMLIPTLLYNVVNSAKSLYKFPDLFWRFCKNTGKDIQEAFQNENIFQLINPFRFLKKISTMLIFIGHVLSTGVASASDENPFISADHATFANALTEGTTDMHQIADCHGHENDSKQRSPAPSHSHRECNGDGHGHSHNFRQQHSHDHDHDHDDDEEDDHHQHGGIILDEIQWVLKWLATGWDFAAGNYFGIKNIYNYFSGASDRHIIENAVEKFSPSKKLPVAPTLSLEWANYEVAQRLREQATYYKNAGIQIKSTAFEKLQEALTSDPAEHNEHKATDKATTQNLFEIFKVKIQTEPTDTVTGGFTKEHFNSFSVCRHRWTSRPRSQEVIDHLRADRSLNRCPSAAAG